MNAGSLNIKQATNHVFPNVRFMFQQLLSFEVLDPRRHMFGRVGTLLFSTNILYYTHTPVFDKAAHFGSDFLRFLCKMFHKLCAE